MVKTMIDGVKNKNKSNVSLSEKWSRGSQKDGGCKQYKFSVIRVQVVFSRVSSTLR